MDSHTIVLTHPDDIAFYRLLTLRSALKLECKGFKLSHGSVYAIVKREFGFKGNKARVLEQLVAHIEDVRNARNTPAVQE